jgi:hypothetical protein
MPILGVVSKLLSLEALAAEIFNKISGWQSRQVVTHHQHSDYQNADDGNGVGLTKVGLFEPLDIGLIPQTFYRVTHNSIDKLTL